MAFENTLPWPVVQLHCASFTRYYQLTVFLAQLLKDAGLTIHSNTFIYKNQNWAQLCNGTPSQQ